MKSFASGEEYLCVLVRVGRAEWLKISFGEEGLKFRGGQQENMASNAPLEQRSPVLCFIWKGSPASFSSLSQNVLETSQREPEQRANCETS